MSYKRSQELNENSDKIKINESSKFLSFKTDVNAINSESEIIHMRKKTLSFGRELAYIQYIM